MRQPRPKISSSGVRQGKRRVKKEISLIEFTVFQMRQDDDGKNSHFTFGCDLKGSERDDCERKPSPIYFPRRERRIAVDREVCDYAILDYGDLW